MNPNVSAEILSTQKALFGKGMNAGDQGGSGDFYRNGGGGGGWYGGYFVGKYKDVGGGAGSSYAFTGSNKGAHGEQNDALKLKNVGGVNGGSWDVPNFNCNGIDKNGNYTGGCFIYNWGKIGRIGDGFAIIEVLYDE